MSTPLIAMLLLGGACWVVRVFAIVILPAERLPSRARDGLGLLAPAVLAALITVETQDAMSGDGSLVAGLAVVSVVTMFVAVRLTGSMVLAIAVGLGAALLIDLVVL